METLDQGQLSTREFESDANAFDPFCEMGTAPRLKAGDSKIFRHLKRQFSDHI
jgi:hypothetical protein